MKKLQYLHFNDNEIEYLPKNLFEDNLELRAIVASNNPLRTIDVDFTKLASLTYLNMEKAKCIDFYPQSKAQVVEAQQIINDNCRPKIF